MDKLHLIANALIERETLEGEEIDQLMKYGKILEKEETSAEPAAETAAAEPVAETDAVETAAAPDEQ